MRGGVHVATTAQKWGGSTGVRIPQELAKRHNITPGTKVEIFEDKGKIVITPIKNKPTLEELTSKCTPENSHEEYFKEQAGKELI